MATVTEVGSDIYRVNVEIPGKPVTFSLFIIRDEQPTLIETSYRRVFDEVIEAVATVIDPSTLRHIVIPHFEGDECGGLNLFLEAAPNAVPVCSPIGANTSIPDFSIREPLRVDEGAPRDSGLSSRHGEGGADPCLPASLPRKRRYRAPPSRPGSLVHSRPTEDRVAGPADLSDRPPPLLAQVVGTSHSQISRPLADQGWPGARTRAYCVDVMIALPKGPRLGVW